MLFVDIFRRDSGHNSAPRRSSAGMVGLMKVGVPSEVKNHEYRVAITPSGVHEFTRHGHEVLVQAGAGLGSSITDEEFVAAGAKIADDHDQVWGEAEMIL